MLVTEERIWLIHFYFIDFIEYIILLEHLQWHSNKPVGLYFYSIGNHMESNVN